MSLDNIKPRLPAAALAARQAPASLASVSLITLPPSGWLSDIGVDYAVRCKTCAHDIFRISGFPKVAPDPSPYFQVPPGETFWQPPHRLRCVSCGVVARIFDARTDGYDGILNGGCTYDSGDEGESFVAGDFRVTISVLYNIDLTELKALADEAKVQAPDLFDSLGIRGVALGGAGDFAVDYECG